MYVPPFDSLLKAIGLTRAEFERSTEVRIPTELFKLLLQIAIANSDFNTNGYLKTNPDVADAVRNRPIEDARIHYVGFGFFEGRGGATPDVDEAWYLRTYTDVADGVRSGQIEVGDGALPGGWGSGRSELERGLHIGSRAVEESPQKALERMPRMSEQSANGVHVGTDGWLFLATGSNEALRLLTDDEWFVTEDAQNWSLKLSRRLETLGALKARYVHMWIPDKIKVYHEHLGFDPEALRVDPPRMVRDCARRMGIEDVIIDPLPVLLDHKGERLLYWKTDTHWTYWGACCAYLALCSAIGANPLDKVWDRPIHYVELALDLGSKLSPPIRERWGAAQILGNSAVVYKNELLRFIEVLSPNLATPMFRGTSIAFRNSGPNCDPRRVLILGDSFSEFRPHLLTGLLAETFREVLFVWSTAFDYNLVRRFSPDIVVSEMAEQFIKSVPEKNLPEDGFDLDSFALDRITHFLNHRCGGGGSVFTWNKRPLEGGGGYA